MTINTDRISLDRNSSISAFSVSGQGGNIDLNIANDLFLANNSTIGAQATGITADNSSSIDGGNIIIDANIITLLKSSEINANAFEGNGGNIDITTQGLFVSKDSLVSASSEFGLDGTIEVKNINGNRPIESTNLSENLINATEHLSAGCNSNSDFAIAGKGGLPENPKQDLRGQAIWQDTRIPLIIDVANFVPKLESISNQSVVEATSWQVNQQGKIELMAISHTDSDLALNTSDKYKCR